MKSARLSTDQVLRELQSRARYIFTPAEFAALSGRSLEGRAVAGALARLAANNRIVLALKRPTKWLIVPAEHAHYGAPPISWWLDDCLKDVEPYYYVGLLSAARHWGSGHYALQATQVMVSQRRLNKAVGQLRIEYTVKSRLAQTPVVVATSQGGRLRVSTREATLLDLMRHQQTVGGLEAISRIARDFRNELSPASLTTALEALDQSAAAQRLGFLLETQGQAEAADALGKWLQNRQCPTVPVEPGEAHSPDNKRTTNRRWRVSYSPVQLEQIEEFS